MIKKLSIMTLEEAIKHCEENVCDNSLCSMEHKQLAEWLKELQALKRNNNSIEERAKEYSKGQWDELTAKNAYIAGATEQKAIDDKLCAGVWIKIDADHPLPYGQEVIGYNKEWVHEDFNPSGTRIGFLNDIGFISAKWINDQDCYVTCSEEGDDYEIFQVLPDGTRKTYCKYENGEAVEGHLPNMPTHFMLIPKTPDGFTWPYNTEEER